MIKRLLILSLLSGAVVIVDVFASFFIDVRWLPDFSLLTVIFATLSLGFRYGFAAALLAGMLKEGFGYQDFGMMLVPYVFCAYATNYLKNFLSLQESLVSRLGIVFVAVLTQILIQTVFFSRSHAVDWPSLGLSVVLPQMCVTLCVSEGFFNLCRPCASKFFA